MDGKLYIYKFIRDDGASLEFDGEEIYLAGENTLLTRPDPATTSIEFTGADGGEMIRQRLSIYEQAVNGLIIPKTTGYWALTTQLSQFFQINHTYEIIYKKLDGGMFAIHGAWISAGLQIVPVPYETHSSWSITLAVGDASWTEYAEDSSGKEIYSNTVTHALISLNAGGEIWDSVGAVWDNVGEEWEKGAGGVQTVNIASTRNVYPVWTVEGPCTNPSLTNNTTDTTASFVGSIASGQTLVVDFASGVAHLDSALVTRYVDGLVSMAPGENTISFNTDSGSVNSSTIQWNNVIN